MRPLLAPPRLGAALRFPPFPFPEPLGPTLGIGTAFRLPAGEFAAEPVGTAPGGGDRTNAGIPRVPDPVRGILGKSGGNLRLARHDRRR
jgi:hypothetical protein